MFGESWETVIADGKVYNAKDAAEKLGLDASGINAKWSKLQRGKDLIKFGGGFVSNSYFILHFLHYQGIFLTIILVLRQSWRNIRHEWLLHGDAVCLL
jgi:hypothetical protein